MISIARNVNHKNNEDYVAWKCVGFLDLNEVGSVMKIIGVAMYLVHSTIPLSKFTVEMFFKFKNGNTLICEFIT